MKLSKYLKIFPGENDSDLLIMYSTRKASAIQVDKETLNAIREGSISNEDEILLSDLEFLVESEEAEQFDLENYITERDNISSLLKITVVLNLDCNFDCSYCIEGKIKGKHYFSEEKIDLLFRFIEERFTVKKDTLRIDFYGGEPLLSKDLIRYISKRALSFTKKRKAKYVFRMVSNGSLLTKNTAEELKDLGCDGIQITIDGNREIHNRNRPFINGQPSFDIVVNNIIEASKFFKIDVNCNYQKENYLKFLKLPQFLKDKGLGSDRINIIFTPVIDQTLDQTAQGITDKNMSSDHPWMIEAENILTEELLRLGYKFRRVVPSACMIERKDMFYIHYNGDIYKCPNFLNNPKFVIGNLKHGIKDYTESHKVGIWKNEKCFNCEYLPLCFGGCRFFSLIRDGHIDNIDCWKKYYDLNLETLVKQDLKSKGVL